MVDLDPLFENSDVRNCLLSRLSFGYGSVYCVSNLNIFRKWSDILASANYVRSLLRPRSAFNNEHILVGNCRKTLNLKGKLCSEMDSLPCQIIFTEYLSYNIEQLFNNSANLRCYLSIGILWLHQHRHGLLQQTFCSVVWLFYGILAF